MSERLRKEMIEAFWAFNDCVERHDWKAALDFFVPGATGGNARTGVVHGREGIEGWLRQNPPDWGYESLWQVVDPPRLVHRWRHWLPGRRPDGSLYEFQGLTELVYACDGRWQSIFTTPDLVGLIRVNDEWRAAHRAA